MKQVYSPSGIAEAHMLVHLLEQEGIKANIEGESLLGAVGELPAGNLMRITVVDEDYEKARKFILEWENNNKSEENTIATGKYYYKSKIFLIALVSFFAGIAVNDYYVSANNQKSYESKEDFNKDGKTDAIYHYSGKYLDSVKTDRNFDGKFDVIDEFNDDGQLVSRKEDNRFAGIFEKTYKYIYESPSLTKEEANISGDEPVRYMTILLNGIPQQTLTIDPETNKTVRIDYYDSNSTLKTAEVDTDGDGSLDTKYTYDRYERITKSEKINHE